MCLTGQTNTCSSTPVTVTILHFLLFNVLPLFILKPSQNITVFHKRLNTVILCYQAISTVVLYISKLIKFHDCPTPSCWISLELSDVLLLRVFNFFIGVSIVEGLMNIDDSVIQRKNSNFMKAHFENETELQEAGVNLKKMKLKYHHEAKKEEGLFDKIMSVKVEGLESKSEIVLLMAKGTVVLIFIIIAMAFATTSIALIYSSILFIVYSWPFFYMFLILVLLSYLTMEILDKFGNGSDEIKVEKIMKEINLNIEDIHIFERTLEEMKDNDVINDYRMYKYLDLRNDPTLDYYCKAQKMHNQRIPLLILTFVIYCVFLMTTQAGLHYDYGGNGCGESMIIVISERDHFTDYYSNVYQSLHDWMMKIMIV